MKTTVTTAAGAVVAFEGTDVAGEAARFCHEVAALDEVARRKREEERKEVGQALLDMGMKLVDMERAARAEATKAQSDERARCLAWLAPGLSVYDSRVGIFSGRPAPATNSEGVAQLPSQGAGSKDREEARDTSTGATKPVDAGESPAPLYLLPQNGAAVGSGESSPRGAATTGSAAGAGGQGAPVDGGSAAPAPAPGVPVCHPKCGTTECPAKHGGKCVTPCGPNGEHWCTGLCRDLGRPLNRPAQDSNDSDGTSGEVERHATDGASSAKVPCGDEVSDAADPREGKVPGNGAAREGAAPSASGATDQEPAGRRDSATPQNTEAPAQAGVGRPAVGGLLPCPFCGTSDVETDENNDIAWCVCIGCGCVGPLTPTGLPGLEMKPEARRLWNQRATEAKGGGAV